MEGAFQALREAMLRGASVAICLLTSEYGYPQSPEETRPTKSDVKDLRDWNPNLTMVFIRQAFGDCYVNRAEPPGRWRQTTQTHVILPCWDGAKGHPCKTLCLLLGLQASRLCSKIDALLFLVERLVSGIP